MYGPQKYSVFHRHLSSNTDVRSEFLLTKISSLTCQLIFEISVKNLMSFCASFIQEVSKEVPTDSEKRVYLDLKLPFLCSS